MERDERRESGEWYPGGRTAQGGGESPGGGGETVPRVPVTRIEELPERFRDSDVRNKINQLCRVVSGGVAALAMMLGAPSPLAVARFVGACVTGTCLADGVTVEGARKDALYNDDFVVTNVTVDLGHLITTNQLAAATGAVAEVAAAKLVAATNDLAGTMGGSIVAASNNLAAAVSHDIAAATNQMGRATDAKLEPYATRSWVQAQGYAGDAAMNSYAQKSWVQEQGYLTAGALTGYATLDWVGRQGYATRADAESMIDARARAAVGEVMAGLDGRTAHRLMAPDADGWIDGTGTVWRTGWKVRFEDAWAQETPADGIRLWTNGTWYAVYTAYTAATGMWSVVRQLGETGLEVEYTGAGLPFGTGIWPVRATHVSLDGAEVVPGQITADGWYQIADRNGNMAFVTPLTNHLEVAIATNAVDRLALASEAGTAADGGLTTNDVCGIVTNVVELDEWTFSGDVVTGVTYTVDLHGWWYDEDTGEAYDEPGEGRYWDGEIMLNGSDGSIGGPEYSEPDRTSWITEVWKFDGEDEHCMGMITATRRHVVQNALGLARLEDVPDVSGIAASVSSNAAAIARLSLAGSPPFDFADMRGVYLSLSNIIHALGGSVTNFPSFSP